MLKKIVYCVLVISAAFLLSSCDLQDGQPLPAKEYKNVYAKKSLLVLGVSDSFANKILEKLYWRLQASYSIKVDGLNKIQDYLFSDYTKIILVEKKIGDAFPQTENYLRGYTGVGNVIVLGIVDRENYSNPRIKMDALYVVPSDNLVAADTSVLVNLIRN